MLEENHDLVADNERHAYVMMHLEVIERGRALLEQPDGDKLSPTDAQPTDHIEQHLDMVDLDEIAEFCRIAFGKGAADFNAGVDAMLAEMKMRQKNKVAP
jgi:hypothetical protein